jgi:DNA-binding transcriptional ArsR family regulator
LNILIFANLLSLAHNHRKRIREGRLKIPHRALIARELAGLLGALSHPHRIRIVEELKSGEMDVNSLQRVLEISHSGVSQNLAVLRAHRLVRERKDGRRVIYSLSDAGLASWLLEGLRFLEGEIEQSEQVRSAAEVVRRIWGSDRNEH